MANFDGTPLVGALTNDPLSPDIKTQQAHYYRVDDGSEAEADDYVYSGLPAVTRASRPRRSAKTSLPVCGILTTPYPCLVMRDGRRIMEGAAIGDCVIVEIGADSVTLTNSTGRFTWKP